MESEYERLKKQFDESLLKEALVALAAPDLLRAAEKLVGLLERVGDEFGWADGGETDRVFAWNEFDELRAAIAKAKGSKGDSERG